MPGKRKAIGEIMAALILMLISSLAGVLLFSISLRTSSVQGEILRTEVIFESESSQERFQVINADFKEEDIEIWVYNYGHIEVEINDVYINGVRTDYYLSGNVIIPLKSAPNKILIKLPLNVTGPEYIITVVSKRGVKNVSEWSN